MKDEPIKVMIVDDDPKFREILAEELSLIPEIKIVFSAASTDEAFHFILTRTVDLIFLDVEMPVKNGFDFLEDIRQVDLNTGIIFTTAYDKYAIKAIKNSAFDYLLKPIDPEELRLAIKRYKLTRERLDLHKKLDLLISQTGKQNKLQFNSKSGMVLINPDEILYCKADWNYTEIHFVDGRKEVVTINLGHMVQHLPENHFIRISRSYIINTNFLEKINKISRKCILKVGNNRIELHIPLTNIHKVVEVIKIHD